MGFPDARPCLKIREIALVRAWLSSSGHLKVWGWNQGLTRLNRWIWGGDDESTKLDLPTKDLRQCRSLKVCNKVR